MPPTYFQHAMSTMVRPVVYRALRGPLASRLQRGYRLAIVKPDRLGDFILASGAIRTLVAHFGAEHCLLVVSSAAAEMAVSAFPGVAREIIPASLGLSRVIFEGHVVRRQLAKFRFDQVVSLRHQRWVYEDLVLSWIRSPRIVAVGPVPAMIPGTVTVCVDADSSAPGAMSEAGRSTGGPWLCHELQQHRGVLTAVMGTRPTEADVLPALPSLETGQKGGGVLVSPFGSQPIRAVPAAALDAAVRRVLDTTTFTLSFIGAVVQRGELERLVRGMGLFTCDRVSVATFGSVAAYASAVARAAGVISADTATAHLAGAFDRPSVIVLGGGHYGQFGPWCRSRRQIWLNQRMPCEGCNWHCVHSEPRCLTGISLAAVSRAVDEMLVCAVER